MKFLIEIKCSSVLDVDELWPDGDAPCYVTVDDVQRRIDAHGGPVRILEEWGLYDHDGECTVSEA